MTKQFTNEELDAIMINVGRDDQDMHYITMNQKIHLPNYKYRHVFVEDRTLIEPIDIGDIKGALYRWYNYAYLDTKDEDPTVRPRILVHKFAADDHRSYQELFNPKFLECCKFYKTSTGYTCVTLNSHESLTMHFDDQGRFHCTDGPAYYDYSIDWAFSIYAHHGRFVKSIPAIWSGFQGKYMYVTGEVADYRITEDICCSSQDNDETHADFYPVRNFPNLNGIYYTTGSYDPDEQEEHPDFFVLCDIRSGQPQPIKLH